MLKHRQPGIILLLAAAIMLLITGGVLAYTGLQRQYTIEVNGETIMMRGSFATVEQAIEAAGVDLHQDDFVWPELDSTPPTAGSIIIRRAKPVELTLDGQTATRWTHQDNVGSFFAEQGITLKRTSAIRMDSQPVDLASLAKTTLGRSVELSSQVDINIDDGQRTFSIQTGATTVGQSLIEAGLDVFAADRVDPPLSTWLQAGERIEIEQATPVTVRLGERELTARTSQQDVAGVLAELAVGLIGRDLTFPALDAQLDSNDQITVERAGAEYELVESSLPFSSQMVPLETLEIDQRSLVSAGSPGTLSQLRRIETIGSETISQTVIGEWISRPPTNEVIGYGTNVVVRTLDTPEGPIEYWRVVRMRVTSYTAATAGKSPDHPGYGITASGRRAGFGVVAIDPDVVPFRSQVYVPGYGIGFAGDTGGGVKGRIIDLGYDDGQLVSWRGYVDVYYLTPVPDAGRINYLIPT